MNKITLDKDYTFHYHYFKNVRVNVLGLDNRQHNQMLDYRIININTNNVNEIKHFIEVIKCYESLFNPEDKYIKKIFKIKNDENLKKYLIKRFDLIKKYFDNIKKSTLIFLDTIL
jgi:ferritin-like protein